MEDKHTYTIDRFEGKYAVCERDDLKFVNILLKELPKDIKEGDILKYNGKEYIVDIPETEKRKKEIEDLTKDLWI